LPCVTAGHRPALQLVQKFSCTGHDQPGGDIASFAHEEIIAAACGPGIHGLKTYSQLLDLRRYKR